LLSFFSCSCLWSCSALRDNGGDYCAAGSRWSCMRANSCRSLLRSSQSF